MVSEVLSIWKFEPQHGKTNKMIFARSEDSDQPGHTPSLIRVSAVRLKQNWVLSYPLSAKRRLRSDWTDAQADLSLRWAQKSFCWFCHEVAQNASSSSLHMQHFWTLIFTLRIFHMCKLFARILHSVWRIRMNSSQISNAFVTHLWHIRSIPVL